MKHSRTKSPTVSCLIVMAYMFVLSGLVAAQDKMVVGPEYDPDPLLTDLGNPKGVNSTEVEIAI